MRQSKFRGPAAALGAALFSAGFLAACGGGIPGDAVVQVNGKAISKTTYDHWMAVAAVPGATTVPGQKAVKVVIPEPPAYTACIAYLKETEPKSKSAKGQKPRTEAQLKNQCEQQHQALQQQVLGFLISSNWVIGEAEEMGVSVTDKEVVKRFNELKKQQFPKEAEFQKFLASTGQSISDLLLRVKLSMLSNKIQEKVTKEAKKGVDEASVAKYYNQNKLQYGQPERRDLRVVLTKGEAEASKAKSEISSGKSFASVAKSKSIDPTSKETGGELPGVVKGEEQVALSKAVFAAKKGVLSGPVKTPFGYYVFEVKTIHPATQQPLSQVKETIKQQLQQTGTQTALSKFVKEFQKKWKGRTECREGYMVQDCNNYKAPKAKASIAPVK